MYLCVLYVFGEHVLWGAMCTSFGFCVLLGLIWGIAWYGHGCVSKRYVLVYLRWDQGRVIWGQVWYEWKTCLVEGVESPTVVRQFEILFAVSGRIHRATLGKWWWRRGVKRRLPFYPELGYHRFFMDSFACGTFLIQSCLCQLQDLFKLFNFHIFELVSVLSPVNEIGEVFV